MKLNTEPVYRSKSDARLDLMCGSSAAVGGSRAKDGRVYCCKDAKMGLQGENVKTRYCCTYFTDSRLRCSSLESLSAATAKDGRFCRAMIASLQGTTVAR